MAKNELAARVSKGYSLTEEVAFMEWTVYEHKNKINGKRYIGITSQPVQRRWKSGYGYCSQKYFYNAIKKYGWDKFEHNILYSGLTDTEAKRIEQSLIDLYNTTSAERGYNITHGGDGSRGVIRSDETKRKIGDTLSGHGVSTETIEKLRTASKGKKHTEESRQKISKSLTGIKRSNTEKQHLSEINKKKIAQINLNGEVVAIHTGIFSVDGYSGQCISLCVRGKLKTHKGYIWKYFDGLIETAG